jgi:signal transduction histidine kinase
VRCVLRETGQARTLSAEGEHALQFALQEALTNAYRHGASTRVSIGLDWRAADVSLSVEDDGKAGRGAPGGAAGVGNGLRGMRERAAALGGSVRAGALDPDGFEVFLTLPISVE